MTKKTSLEWFLEAIGYKQEFDRTTIINIHPDCDITDLIKQAKQMEKEQIMNAYNDGADHMFESKYEGMDNYYKLRYGSDNKI